MRLLRHIWKDIRQGDNIDLYTTVVAAIGLALLNLFGAAPASLLAPLTLAILGLIAISTVGTRHKIEQLSRGSGSSVDYIFLDEFPASLVTDIENAKEIWLMGVTFSRTIKANYALFEQKLRKGHSIRILLVDPYGTAVKGAADRVYKPTSVEQKRAEILSSLQDLTSLQKLAPKKLEIRVIDNPLTYGARIVNPNSSMGVLYLEHYAYKAPDSKPKFIIHAKEEKWYKFYLQEYQAFWNNGIEWKGSINPNNVSSLTNEAS